MTLCYFKLALSFLRNSSSKTDFSPPLRKILKNPTPEIHQSSAPDRTRLRSNSSRDPQNSPHPHPKIPSFSSASLMISSTTAIVSAKKEKTKKNHTKPTKISSNSNHPSNRVKFQVPPSCCAPRRRSERGPRPRGCSPSPPLREYLPASASTTLFLDFGVSLAIYQKIIYETERRSQSESFSI